MDRLKQERNEELIKAYKRALKSQQQYVSQMPLNTFVSKVVNSGAPRFFISEEQAAKIINKMELGEQPKKTNEKIKLCEDLYAVYLEVSKKMDGCFKYRIIEAAVNSPARSFYITAQRALDIIWGK